MTSPRESRYEKALAWARGLRDPESPLKFPDHETYLKLAAQNADIDVAQYSPEENQFHELPEEYELAYLTVKLERQKERAEAGSKDVDV